MDNITLADLINVASKIGVVSMFVVILWGGVRQWWVFGWYWREKQAECDRLQAQLDRLTGLNERTVETMESAVRSPPRGSHRP